MAKPSYSFLSLLFCLLVSFSVFSQKVIDVEKYPGKLIFDGRLDEADWEKLPKMKYVMQLPNFGNEPTERSDIYLTYDENYLYLVGRFHLSDSTYYRPTTFKRDAFDGTTDYFGLVIDSYNDKENGVAFFTGPTGFRLDGTVWNDAQAAPGEMPVSTDWNTFWDVKVAKTNFGWSTEMRIPWTSLRFQDDNGTVVMGATSWWYIAAKNEVVMYPPISLEYGDWSGWKSSKMQEYRFEGIYAKKPIYITPYALTGLQQTNELNEAGTGYELTNEPTYEAGLDLKTSLTSNLTLDLTVNTDFAQVEADDQQVNLTRFSLFFPEKRQFFQERASIFDFNFEQFNRLFYSRKIGLDEDNNPVRILGGARLVGRLGKHDLGFLNMQTGSSSGANSENFGLLRVRRQISESNSYLGAILTNRTDFENNRNFTYGLDGIFKISGDDYLTAKWAQSFADSTDSESPLIDPTRLFLQWERRTVKGLFYSLIYSRAGEDYVPGMGFEFRENFNSWNPRIGYGKFGNNDSKIIRWQVSVDALSVQNNATQKTESAILTPAVQIATKKGWNYNASVILDREFLAEPFELSAEDQSEGLIEIPTGEYDFVQFQANVNTPFQNFFSLWGNVSAGGFFDGNLVSVDLGPRWKYSNKLEFEGFYQFSRAEFSTRNQTFESHLARVKALYTFNTKVSIAAFVQFAGLDEIYLSNVRFRYNPREGNDLYIVYNDVMNNRRNREFPNLPFSDERAIVVKYTYTFRL